jgi:hypothetical protein
MPAVTEAIEEERWADMDRAIKITAQALNEYSNQLDRAATAIPNGAARLGLRSETHWPRASANDGEQFLR